MKNKLIAVLLTFSSFFAFAGGISNGQVGLLIVNMHNFLFFSTGTKTGSPACGNNNQWAISLDTQKGKSVYALLLYAQAQQKPVVVVGNGTCAAWGDREDVQYILAQ